MTEYEKQLNLSLLYRLLVLHPENAAGIQLEVDKLKRREKDEA